MFDDPYRILGLRPDASDDEVKQAYRSLAKKYHPDMNPGDENAARKMNEVNAAYDQIKNPPQQATFRNAYDPFRGWAHQNTRSTADGGSVPMQAARHFVQFGSYADALRSLDAVPQGQRTAEWYYLAAISHTNLGRRLAGLENIRVAVAMEPDNDLYRATMAQIQDSGTVYTRTRKESYSAAPENVARACCALCVCTNFALGFCGGGLRWLICCT